MFLKTSRKQYESGNKPGRLLAEAIKPRRTRNYVEKIKDKKGTLKYTRDISKTFLEYYQSLYKVSDRQDNEEIQKRKEKS